MNWKLNSKILIIKFNLQTQLLSNHITEFRSRGLYIILTNQREVILEFVKTIGLKKLLRTRITGDYLDENALKLITRLNNRQEMFYFKMMWLI